MSTKYGRVFCSPFCTDALAKHIPELLFLCPKIQKEVLLVDMDIISRVTESIIRPITKEVVWQDQLFLFVRIYMPNISHLLDV